MRKERLSLRYLYFFGATFPNTVVVRCDGVFQCRFPGLYSLESLHEAVCGVESVVGALTAVYKYVRKDY